MKNSTNVFQQYQINPYDIQDPAYLMQVEQYISSNNTFCSIKYLDALKINYELHTFDSFLKATSNGNQITHKGINYYFISYFFIKFSRKMWSVFNYLRSFCFPWKKSHVASKIVWVEIFLFDEKKFKLLIGAWIYFPMRINLAF